MFSFRARARRPPWSNPFGGGGNAAQLFEHAKDAAVVGLHVPAEAANSALERGLKPVMKSTLPTPWACICHTGLWHKEARRGPLRVKEVSLLRRFCNVVQKLRADLKKADEKFDGGGKYNRFLQGNLIEVFDTPKKLLLPHDYQYTDAKLRAVGDLPRPTAA